MEITELIGDDKEATRRRLNKKTKFFIIHNKRSTKQFG